MKREDADLVGGIRKPFKCFTKYLFSKLGTAIYQVYIKVFWALVLIGRVRPAPRKVEM